MKAPDRSWLALDLRSLALFRILLASLVILDVVTRLGDVGAFYTDGGVLPRAAALAWPHLGAARWLCAFMGSGSAPFQVAVMLLIVLSACTLLIGRQTRLMTAVVWILLCSMHLRDILVCDRGSKYLELMLFWSMFLPLGACWSWDARHQARPRSQDQSYRSLATVALVAQFAMIYFFAALLKSGPAWISRFDAVYWSLRSALFATPLSLWLSHFPALCKAFTPLVLAFEFGIPLLLFWPWAHRLTRTLVVGALFCFHLCTWLLFRLGYFPLIAALLPCALLPAAFWEGPGRRLGAWLERLFPRALSGEPTPHTVYRPGRVERAFVGVCLACCLYWNVTTYPVPSRAHLVEPMLSFGRALCIEQSWDLFAPNPPDNAWLRLLATRSDGRQVDLLRPDGKVTTRRPPNPWAALPDSHWHMLWINVLERPDLALRARVAHTWARLYGRRWGPGLHDLRLQAVVVGVDSSGQALPARVVSLWAEHGPSTYMF